MLELLPTKATFAPGEPVEVEVRGAEEAVVELWHLDRKLAEAVAAPVADFGPLEPGGYGVEAAGARTALDVLANPFERLRYGFVSDYASGRDPGPVADNVRRLHLNAVQFYDWMYRHADLLPPEDEFEDALGRPVSLATVRALAGAIRDAGSAPLGYAAVYAAGKEHHEAWELLYRADGTPWMLGDFLWIVDPSSERWLEHFAAQLAAATESVGFAGFHLDQYGAPKRAQRADGSVVDLAEAFPTLIERLRNELGETRLIFNNVNDFPTWATASTPQDAVYVEVWSPHDRLDHLGSLVQKAKLLAPEKAVSLAAYLSTYDGDPTAMQLELATVFSHGGTCLLHGEADAILTDPYYVRHERMNAESIAAARAYYDFAVRYGDLLFGAVDVTRTHSGGINEEVRVDGASSECEADTLWARVLETTEGLVVSLIDVPADVRWDSPKPAREHPGTTVTLEPTGPEPPAFLFATPEAPALVELPSERLKGRDVVRVPAFRTWGLLLVRR